MKTYIVLLRGINVGGKNLLPMKSLKGNIEDLEGENVQTYIQSGNVVFKHNNQNEQELSDMIRAEIKKQMDFDTHLMN